MPKYLFTSDQRISELPDRIKQVSTFILNGHDISEIVDKSDNNNSSTLKFYYNLHSGTETCSKSSENPIFGIRNFILKFQYPNTRTQESMSNSLGEKTLFAPFRSVVTILYLMAIKDEKLSAWISLNEILYYLFCNPYVYKNPLVDYNKIIDVILKGREQSVDLTSEIESLIEWKQYGRQSRELFNVLTYASSCFKLSNGIISFSLNSDSYENDKYFIDQILGYSKFWYPSNPSNFNLSNLEYISYMDTANTPYNVIDFNVETIEEKVKLSNLPLQQIFYGAPGTGKSNETNKIVSKYADTVRTTFHPDSDYSTFVGAYKPTMTNVRKSVIIGQDEKEVNPLANSSKNEERITYRFVKQAFLKAYIRAWNKFVNSSMNSVNNPISFSTKWGEYTVSSINETNIGVNKTEIIEKQTVQNSWSSAWKGSGFDPNNITNNSIAKAICQWIVDNTENATIDSFGDGWNKFFDSAKNVINEYKPVSQSYTFYVTNDKVFVTAPQHPNKETIREAFDREEINSQSTAAGLARRLKEIYPNVDFDEVWNNVSKLTVYENSFIPQYLVIEEINRGNCAQIFGDLFQLLDRKNGFSEYPIEADDDIRKTLIEENPDDGLSFHGLKFTQEQKEFINSNFKGQNIADKIINGNVLVLPPNLFIWATMNTSDQSLFPMDSAFKRRWEWKYMKIKEGKDDRGHSLNWEIVIKEENDQIVKINGEDSLSWWKFIQKVNEIIASMTSSADKQIGYFFCKANNGVISAETFVNKVVFYLWNDVFKDYGFEDSSLFTYEEEKNGNKVAEDLTFPDFFDENGEKVNAKRVADFIEKVMKWNNHK